MAYNGAGVFNRLYSWITDRNNGVKIQASRMDAEMDGIATALSNAICRDGQSTITANIPFNSQRATGVGNATADTDALNRTTADGRYLRHGECYLGWASTTSMNLGPYNGNKLIINGVQQTIPAAGVSYTITGTGASALYYVYAFMSGSTMTLEASATAYATDSTTGVVIKSGDATRTLVGAFYTYGGVNTMGADGSGSVITLISWFNRKRRRVAASVASSTLAGASAALGAAVVVTNWTGESVTMENAAFGYHNIGGGTITHALGLDGVTGYTHGVNYTVPTATYYGDMSQSFSFAPVEGAHTLQTYGQCNNVGPGSAHWWWIVTSATTMG